MTASPVLERLLSDKIRFHWYGEQDWGTGAEVLAYLDQTLTPSMTTIETGAGKSTVLFAAKGCRHVTITPASGEYERIRAYANTEGISLDRCTFLWAPSERVLPELPNIMGDTKFDLALIDGSHAFPWPFLDFFYLSRALRQQGLLIVDDIGIWSCGRVAEFLLKSPEWRLVTRLNRAQALVFEKSATDLTDEWMRQPFRFQHPFLRRVRRRIAALLRLVRR